MTKKHCDLCDVVIEPTVERLTILVGLWKWDEGVDERETRDYCGPCTESHPFLKRLFEEQLVAGTQAEQ